MNYYPFHIGDFRSGTVNMTRQARWIYRDMLDVYYDTEKPLPLDLDVLCDLIGADTEDERRIVERLLRFKFIKGDDGYHHEICDKVLSEYRVKSEVAKENGKKSAATRYQNGEYMPIPGSLYAVRVNPGVVKIGVSGNLKSRLHQLRSKYGKQAVLIHHVIVAHMGDAEAELLDIYKSTRDGEEFPVTSSGESDLFSHMDRISVASRSHANQEPITNNQEPVKSKAKGAPASPLPDWLPLESWLGYLDMRKKQKKTPTDRAVTLLLNALDAMRSTGQDIAAVLDKSTKNNWTDVYAIKDEQRPGAPPIFQTANEKAKAFADELTGRNRHEPTFEFIDINGRPP